MHARADRSTARMEMPRLDKPDLRSIRHRYTDTAAAIRAKALRSVGGIDACTVHLTTWNEHGDGVRRGNVHIMLLEDLTFGRIERRSGDFLCKRAEPWAWNYTADYKPICKRCEALARRINANGKS